MQAHSFLLNIAVIFTGKAFRIAYSLFVLTTWYFLASLSCFFKFPSFTIFPSLRVPTVYTFPTTSTLLSRHLWSYLLSFQVSILCFWVCWPSSSSIVVRSAYQSSISCSCLSAIYFSMPCSSLSFYSMEWISRYAASAEIRCLIGFPLLMGSRPSIPTIFLFLVGDGRSFLFKQRTPPWF